MNPRVLFASFVVAVLCLVAFCRYALVSTFAGFTPGSEVAVLWQDAAGSLALGRMVALVSLGVFLLIWALRLLRDGLRLSPTPQAIEFPPAARSSFSLTKRLH